VTRYSLPILLPDLLDSILAAPLLILRWLWYGQTFRRIKLYNLKKYALVSQCDYAMLKKHQWYAIIAWDDYRAARWVAVEKRPVPIYMHRQIMTNNSSDTRSSVNNGLVIDHINHNPLDNRRKNLRWATRRQNAMNSRKPKGCSSDYRGVHYNKLKCKWLARITVNGKRISLGSYQDEAQAAHAYDKAAKIYFKDFANLNFPKKKIKGLREIIIRFLSLVS
jgi:hypothetical protein